MGRKSKISVFHLINAFIYPLFKIVISEQLRKELNKPEEICNRDTAGKQEK